jgi:hypothetical protein
MSDTTDELLDPPGCGVGLYAGLLMFICLLGVAGLGVSTLGLLNATPDEARNLVHGSEVSVWRLQPMRDAQLLRLTEVPAAWHDRSASYDGTDACGLGEQGVLQLREGVGTAIAFTTVSAVEMRAESDGSGVVSVTGNQGGIRCRFGPGEGGERFARQIEAERIQSAD